MKCLEKDRGRRYETANGLATDLQRHLNNEPVVAGRPGNVYRLGKFVLGDHSANGTYVTFENEPEIVLRREEVVLRNRGSIAFGQSRQTATEVAEFSCE